LDTLPAVHIFIGDIYQYGCSMKISYPTCHGSAEISTKKIRAVFFIRFDLAVSSVEDCRFDWSQKIQLSPSEYMENISHRRLGLFVIIKGYQLFSLAGIF
jgi:hypothetical protein